LSASDLSEKLRRSFAARTTPRGTAVWCELAAVILLAVLCGAFFWRAVTLQGVFFHYDHAIQNYPYRLFFARGLREGRLPLWSGDIFCGFPLLAESQGNALYPPFLVLFRFLEPWVAYNYYHVLHFFLAGLFTYVLARVMRLGRPGALLAGLCYMLSGPVLFHAHHTNIIVGVCWLPLLLALTELACRTRKPLPLLGFAAATGALVLGAQPQYTLYCALAVGLYLLWRLHLAEATGERRRRVVAWGVLFGLAGALGAGLAAAQLLPLAELVSHSSRALGPAVPRAAAGVPANLMTLFLPQYFGSSGLGSYWGDVDEGLYSELMLFMGVAPLLLALVGAFAERRRKALFFAGFGAFSFIFSLGFSGSLYALFWALPVFRSSRFPSRFGFVTALCVAMLAGMGLEQLLQGKDRLRIRKAAVVSAGAVLALAVVALAITAAYQAGLAALDRAALAAALPLTPFKLEVLWTHLHRTLPADVWRLVVAAAAGSLLLLTCSRRAIGGKAAAALWCVLIFAELAWAGREFNPVTDPAIYTEPPPLAKALQELPPGRIFRYRYYDSQLPAARADYSHTRGWAVSPEDYVHCLDRLPHNANMIWGIPSVNGFSPLQTTALKAMLDRPESRSTMIEFNITPALDLLGARYVLSPHDEIPGEFEHIEKVGAINVFRNPRALPRAFIVHKGVPVSDTDPTLRRIADREFDFGGMALIHDPPGPLVQLEPGPTDAGESARVMQDTGDSITVLARTSRPGYLVLADQHYPGWQVRVNGKPAELLRVDYLLKAVELAAGTHAVQFEFRPASFRIGLAITWGSLGILALALVLCVLLRRKRRPVGAAPEPDLLEQPYSGKAARFALFCAVLFAALGPLVRPSLWERTRYQLSPRRYVVYNVVGSAGCYMLEERVPEAYALVRDACRWWPECPLLRPPLVSLALRRVAGLVSKGQSEEAVQIAREVMAIAPDETRRKAPALAAMAAEAPPQPLP